MMDKVLYSSYGGSYIMNIIEVTEATFEAEVLQEERFVVVDFWATYCMPCQMLTPILEELAAERPDIKFCKINMEEAQSIAEKYDIMTLPILIFFKNGKVVDESIGLISKEQLQSFLK